MPLTRVELERLRCGEPTCDDPHEELHIQAVCHRSAALDVAYSKKTGVLTMRCHLCGDLVVEIQVAMPPARASA